MRRLATLCSALSLLLCVAVCAVWVRSHLREDLWSWTVDQPGKSGASPGTLHMLHVGRGSWRHASISYAAGFPGTTDARGRLPFVEMLDRISIGNSRSSGPQPLWVVAALAGAPAFIILGARLRRRLHKPPPGHCHRCGYDLRTSPEQCPECGTANPSFA